MLLFIPAAFSQGLCDGLFAALEAVASRARIVATNASDFSSRPTTEVGDVPADQLTGLGSLTTTDIRAVIGAASRMAGRSSAQLRALVTDLSNLSEYPYKMAVACNFLVSSLHYPLTARGFVTRDALGSYL